LEANIAITIMKWCSPLNSLLTVLTLANNTIPMSRETLLEAIKERPLLGDGGMGTQLIGVGLKPGGCGESWNLEAPEKIVAIQRKYVDAGSDCLITNTFGGCGMMLKRHGHDGNVAEINKAAVQIAREAFGDKAGYVLGDVGPFGGIMEPYGLDSEDDVRATITEQVNALVEAGADAIIVETQTALEELGIGIEAALEAGAPCVIGSLAYDLTADGQSHRTMMGVSPEAAAEFLQEKGAHIVALNCGSGMDMREAAKVISLYRKSCDLPCMAQPNAGKPELVDGAVVYREDAASMASGVIPLLDAGANIVGGCCGSTPEHIAAFRVEMDRWIAAR
jgi:5-methyltetrahydrofolate--homocysteine methyltransferase